MSDPRPPSHTSSARRLPRVVQWLLRVPLFYKILLANAVLIVAATSIAAVVMAGYVRRNPGAHVVDVVVIVGLVGLVATALVNALILRLALQPLDALERTAARVQQGDLDARVARSPLADRGLDRLTRTFNDMLDSGEVYRARLRDVASQALGAAEEERKRIARELHDETAQLLAALLIRIRVVKGARDADALAALLEEMRVEIGHALEGIRRFARGLRPPALDELGLVPAIESHLRSIEAISEIQVSLDADGVPGTPLAPETELAVYRIVQEALSNVLKHSGAREASVRLVREADRLLVTVEDDGRGFSVGETMSAGAGLGLFGMRERAAYLGGRVEVTSTPGTGTRVRAEVPLAPDAAPPTD